jgi:hypothetical protein
LRRDADQRATAVGGIGGRLDDALVTEPGYRFGHVALAAMMTGAHSAR